jgi:Vacuolar protein sorting-associated protein 62
VLYESRDLLGHKTPQKHISPYQKESHMMKYELAWWNDLATRLRPFVEICRAMQGPIPFYERHMPSSIDYFVENSYLRSRADTSLKIRNPSPEDFAKYNGGEFYLQPDESVYNGSMEGAPYYVRIRKVDKAEHDNDDVVEIQYWFFYPYNGAVMKLFGAHEGDWEHVKVRVDVSSRRILKIYFAAHGSAEGRWVSASTKTPYPDRDTYMLRTDEQGNDRPVVFSAWHTHASYPSRQRYYRLKGFVVDYPFGGRTWDGQVKLVSVDPRLLEGPLLQEPAWLRWRGRWGSTQESIPHVTSNSPDGPMWSKGWGTMSYPLSWGDWFALDATKSDLVDVAACPAVDGRIHVVALQGPARNVVLASSQDPSHPTGWAPLTGIGGARPPIPLGKLFLAPNGDGGLLTMSGGADNTLVLSKMAPGGGTAWSDWHVVQLGNAQTMTPMSMALDYQSCLHILLLGEDGNVYELLQEEPGSGTSWRGPYLLEGIGGDNSAVLAINPNDGSLVALVTKRDGSTFIGAFAESGWYFPSAKLPSGHEPMLLTANRDTRLEAFSFAPDGTVYHCYQIAPQDKTQWSDWLVIQPAGFAPGIEGLCGALQANGEMCLFGWTNLIPVVAYQLASAPPIQQGWRFFESFAATYLEATALTLAQNQDGRLELFCINQKISSQYPDAPLRTILHCGQVFPDAP